jgi:hypothetical protein
MSVIETYKYQLHFHCPGCGYAWVEGHHVVTLEEPCPRWFCSDEPIVNHAYERAPKAATPAGTKRVPRRAA